MLVAYTEVEDPGEITGSPENKLESLFNTFEYELSDPSRTSIHHKGQGVQSTALLATLNWISKTLIDDGLTPIWLLEEPESYLHPELAKSALRLVDLLRKTSPVLVTTHALSFVPQNVNHIQGTHLENGQTTLTKCRNYREATSSLAKSLGVSFSDYFNLGESNILVEGPSDRTLIDWALKLISASDQGAFPHVRSAALLDFGGVRHLAGFLRANYPFIRDERATVSLFDGDDAARKEWTDLQSYLGNHDSAFESGLDFVTVRTGFSIEGLFPDEWINDIYELHPNWFSFYAVDSQGDLEPYNLKDDKKAQAQALLVDRAESTDQAQWIERWTKLFSALDDALGRQKARIGKKSRNLPRDFESGGQFDLMQNLIQK